MKVIFTCGGTAGHVNPALALAGYMQNNFKLRSRLSHQDGHRTAWICLDDR